MSGTFAKRCRCGTAWPIADQQCAREILEPSASGAQNKNDTSHVQGQSKGNGRGRSSKPPPPPVNGSSPDGTAAAAYAAASQASSAEVPTLPVVAGGEQADKQLRIGALDRQIAVLMGAETRTEPWAEERVRILKAERTSLVEQVKRSKPRDVQMRNLSAALQRKRNQLQAAEARIAALHEEARQTQLDLESAETEKAERLKEVAELEKQRSELQIESAAGEAVPMETSALLDAQRLQRALVAAGVALDQLVMDKAISKYYESERPEPAAAAPSDTADGEDLKEPKEKDAGVGPFGPAGNAAGVAHGGGGGAGSSPAEAPPGSQPGADGIEVNIDKLGAALEEECKGISAEAVERIGDCVFGPVAAAAARERIRGKRSGPYQG